MKRLIYFSAILLFILSFSSCKVFKYITESPPPSDEELFLKSLQNFNQTALFNIDYNSLRLNPETFENKTLRVFGVIVEEFDRDFLLFTNPFEDNEYGFYRIIIDSPLPKQGDYPKPLKYISRGSEVNVFGIYKGLTSINPDQISLERKSLNPHIDFRRLKNIPTIEAVAIYDRSDLRFERPLWVSQKFILENYKSRR